MLKILYITKRQSIWILLIIQLLLIASYFLLKLDNQLYENNKIKFIRSSSHAPEPYTYHQITSHIHLGRVKTKESYMDFNSSLCYRNGTDLPTMKRTKDNWECKCLTGWHGKDCAQPEIVWRTFLTQIKALKIHGPRLFKRRLIYLFPYDKFTEVLTEIRVNELEKVVDLFVIYENDHNSEFQRQLKNSFLKNFHNRILYIKSSNLNSFHKTITDLRDDDVILSTKNNEIPNRLAVNYLKYYNNWPEPIHFRLRWSVYGFFWLHPHKTITSGSACTVSYLKNNLSFKIESLHDHKPKDIIFGDLNHFGGWICEFCNDPKQIIQFLTDSKANVLQKRTKIDQDFLEDAIENGLYINGSELKRAHRYSENYFAPFYVIENEYRYDSLLINFYSKIDYYEG